VQDGETIILGGFIRTSKSKSRSGVPILKDIPVLGMLFSSNSRNNDRSELIVLMRPTVLKDPKEASKAAKNEMERLPGVQQVERDFQEAEKASLEKSKKKTRKK
jgi:general secretion pathway protein D